MRFDLILEPFFYYLLLAAGMGLCLYLFVVTKKQLYSATSSAQRQAVKLKAALADLEKRLAEVDADLKETRQGMSLMVAPKPTPSGLNLNRRSQAFRMARRGDRPDQIAAALQIPHSEVVLLMKVQRAMAQIGPSKNGVQPVVANGDHMPDPAGAAGN